MKFTLIIFFVLYSMNSFSAGRLPTTEELDSFEKMINSDDSIDPIIRLIENGEIDPFFHYDPILDGAVSSKNKTSLFNTVVIKRMNAFTGFKGIEQENIKLLKLLIAKGVDTNLVQSTSTITSADSKMFLPLQVASSSCSASVVSLLLEAGANPSANPNIWIFAFNRSQSDTDNSIKDKCRKISEYFLSKAPYLENSTVFSFFATPSSRREMSFVGGDGIEYDFTPEMIRQFDIRFGVKISKKPTTNEPDDAWFEIFLKHLERPAPNTRGDDRPFAQSEDRAKEWWSELSADSKAWACYYSTFDEAIGFLLQAGNDLKDSKVLEK